MHDEHPHPLLAQLPLTVSPFLSLPTATTLPYTYKTLPSTLPPSILSSQAPSTSTSTSQPSDTSTPQPPQKPTYITSSSGHTAHPDDIIASCRALRAHLQQMEEEGRRKVEAWERERRERELAEKRRVAPGWLDQDVKLLVPEKRYEEEAKGDGKMGEMEMEVQRQDAGGGTEAGGSREAEELDRAFGGMGIR